MSRAALFACLMWLCPACGDSAQTSVNSGPPDPWTLVWSDEFDGETVNSEHWSYSIGTGAEEGLAQWGNGELQSYTDAPENCSVSEGVLRITALKTGDEPASYTSARLHTRETRRVRPTPSSAGATSTTPSQASSPSTPTRCARPTCAYELACSSTSRYPATSGSPASAWILR